MASQTTQQQQRRHSHDGDNSDDHSASDGEGDNSGDDELRHTSASSTNKDGATSDTNDASSTVTNGAKYRRNKSAMANVCRRWRVSGMCAWLPDRCGFEHPPHLAGSVTSSRNAVSDTTLAASSMVLSSASSDEEWAILLRPMVVDRAKAEKVKGEDTRATDVAAARKVIERKLFQSERAIHLMIEEDGYIEGDDVAMDEQMAKLRRQVDEAKKELAKPVDLSGHIAAAAAKQSKRAASAAAIAARASGETKDNTTTTTADDGKRKRTVRIGRARKAYAFIQWIVDTFTVTALQPRVTPPWTITSSDDEIWPRVGVVDVAGGRGDVSYVLAAFYQIRSLIIDPRAPSFRKMSHSLRRAQTKHADKVATVPSAISASGADLSTTVAGAATVVAPSAEGKRSRFEFIPPQHVGLCFPLPYVLPSTTLVTTPGALTIGNKGVARGHALATYYHKYHDESNGVDKKSITGVDAPAKLAQLRRHMDRALDSCSIVIGLHPDQATEPLIDWCLLNNRSFAVLPCCVFPTLFPLRHTAATATTASLSSSTPSAATKCCSGDHIVDDRETSHHHAQFCRYLASKDPRIRVTALPIRGRNIVVYAHLTHAAPAPVPTTALSKSS